MKEGFVFYRSWLDAIKNLPREMQGEVLTAIIEYGLYGETTESPKPITNAMLAMVKPQIDANNQRYENGKKGGRPRKTENQTETKPKPNHNQEITKPKPNRNQTITKQEPKDKDKVKDKEDTSKEASKKEAAVAATLARKQNFYQSLVPYVSRYGTEMVGKFFNYWAEMNKSCSKMRWELEKTWELGNRLATWARKEKDYDGNSRSADKSAKAQQLISEYAAIEQGCTASENTAEIPDL